MNNLVRSQPRAGLLVVAITTVIAAGGGWAFAARGTSGTLHACAKNKTGALRLATRCKKSEKAVSWNIQGRQGSPGAEGASGAQGASGAVGAQGSPGVQYAWSAWTYPKAASPQPDGHVATFNFTSPTAGSALVTASFQIRVQNTSTENCHVESQLASAPVVLGKIEPGEGSPGFIDQWVNQNLPTHSDGETDLGLSASVSRVFPVTAGSNTVYLNGRYTGYPTAEPYNCTEAFWGPISISAVFADQTPAATLTAP